ncbi:MAG: right-handed parallel beta-helix repeat-containing protein [Planctomycetes bacterium]|nr:right-handed parallel beta-helix repeat-containing protein [Planctomycetota bacterium]
MVNVLDFGATGDGKTDDTEALQHALEEGDGALHLKKGTYRITRPLVLDLTKHGFCAIRGKEAGTSRILMAGAGPAIRIIGDHRGTAQPDTVKPHTWEKERLPTINGIEILGAHPEAVGIELRKTMQATIGQVLVRNCKYGIHLVERNRNFLLADSHLYDNSEYGLFLDRCNLHQIIVHGNHISYNKKAGIKSLDGDVHNLQITGNDIEYNNHPGVDKSPNGEPTGAEIWFEAPEGIISEVTIASNTIQATVQPGGANIRIWGSQQDWPRGARLISITGNVLGSQTRGIELRRVQRVAITGNTIYNSADLSIFASFCSGVAVGTNTFVWRGREGDSPRDGIRFEDCENGALSGLVTQRLCAGTAEKGAGITLTRCRDMAISDCQILDPLVRGIELEDCIRCRVSNNSIIDRRDKPTMLNAIRVLGKSRDNLVQNNLLGGAKEQLLDILKGTAILQGNSEIV